MLPIKMISMMLVDFSKAFSPEDNRIPDLKRLRAFS
jgi:hypothetical protein